MPGVPDGRVAVITGGATGIGLATAARFLAEGASEVLAGRRQSEPGKAVANLGSSVIDVRADVSNLADLDRLCTCVTDGHGHVDILFANASIARPAPIEIANDSACGLAACVTTTNAGHDKEIAGPARGGGVMVAGLFDYSDHPDAPDRRFHVVRLRPRVRH
jgi:NAD(P)-dependent dehydrogenase (short-subunit alcohol dehydrogenase family)